jgi:predicted RNA-binding protein YlxR (DUF448 family)
VSGETLPIEIEPAGGRRRCLVARAAGERARMVRFVLGPEGVVVPDVDERLPGRGLWVAADRAALAEAVRRNLFAKAAGVAARPPADLVEQVDAAVRRRCLDLLGLARRAGVVVAGFDQVRAALEERAVALVLVARDAASQVAKLRRLAGALPFFSNLERGELGRALGRDELVYVAVGPGGLARKLERELVRLDGLARETRPSAPGGSGTQQGGDDR